VLDHVPAGAGILSQEIFGPVAPIVRFSDSDQAIALANSTEYGLVSYLYSADLRRALAVAEALESGMVGINRGVVSDPAAPFGGVKQSGLGREGGHDGLLEFTETKYIASTGDEGLAHGPENLRAGERVRRDVHVPGPAAAVAGRGRAVPVPPRGLLGPQQQRIPAHGARLYLDVGSHPEYATPECDSLIDLVTHDKAGERILEGLLVDADRRLREEGIAGDIYLFQEQHRLGRQLLRLPRELPGRRHGEFGKLADVLIPFLVTRQIICGAGKVLQTPRGAVYCVSQRAEHIWEGVSSATTRSRPIIKHPGRAARRRPSGSAGCT